MVHGECKVKQIFIGLSKNELYKVKYFSVNNLYWQEKTNVYLLSSDRIIILKIYHAK